MNKEEFLKELRNKISILKKEEIDDVINEYNEFIDEKKKSKKKESVIIEELGNIDDLASEILKAYNVNNGKSKNTVNEYAKKFFDTFEQIINKISKRLHNATFSEIFKFIIELFLICLLIIVIKLPFSLIENAFLNIFYTFTAPFNEIFASLFKIIIEISYIVIGFMLLVAIFKERYLSEDEKEPKSKSKIIIEEKENSGQTIKVKDKRGAIDGISSIFLLITKIIVLFFTLPILFTFVFSVAIFVFSILFSIEYLLVLGVILFALGIIIGHIWLLTILYSFIFNKSNDGKHLLRTFIISLLLIGCGCGYTAMQFTNMDYLSFDESVINSKKVTNTYDLDKVLTNDNKQFDIFVEEEAPEIVIDESLKNNIIIETYTADFISIKGTNTTYYDYKLEYEVKFRDLLKFMSKNAKDKKIYRIDDESGIHTVIYVSSSNKEKLNITQF